jgi:DNA gyrase subunit B
VEHRTVKLPALGAQFSGTELERLLQRLIVHRKLIKTIERRGHPVPIVEALVTAGADREFFADKQKLDALAEALTTPTRRVTVQPDEEHNRFSLRVDDRSSGYPRQHIVGVDFVTAGEYRTLVSNHRDIPAVSGEIIVSTSAADSIEAPEESAVVEGAETAPTDSGVAPDTTAPRPADTGRKPKEPVPDVQLGSIDELVDFFIVAGKKGIAVNRYKGLGEMNPDQLWETTMDPAVRTLLQVRAEDHTEADLMFTTLMGDQVEPRRKFIEDNALDVKNLDV